ncbi:pre-B-cell leukemia transcription factor-interacting protein 1 isoform X2 [Protopterus annectens]|uniref:pre-B-cell leukemia transcription factor-interacting protein 1 isoform X2 n=1 Tax=Protopterus annectens TaxID=7888 RepID=UPI001CFABA27|nr:pre-B-cell leukemia transcription factor-interacting protein 1 isoform X2 [Protopterus annectens]
MSHSVYRSKCLTSRMSENSNSNDSNSSWILVGSQVPEPELVGPLQDVINDSDETQEHLRDTRQPAVPFETETLDMKQEITADSDKKEHMAAEEMVTSSAAETQEKEGCGVENLTASQYQSSEDVEIPKEEETEPAGSDPGALIGKADEDVEELESSSSDESMEGLRRRQVVERNSVQTADTIEKGETESGDSGIEITLNKCIIAAILLAFVGLSLFSGSSDCSIKPIFGEAMPILTPVHIPTRPVEDDLKNRDVREAKVTPSPDTQADAQNLLTMTTLLDKLAKENQEIRLMQAELQTQKSELEALMKKNEDENLTQDAPQQILVQENVLLKDSLKQQETALFNLQEELVFLRERLGSLEGESIDAEVFHSENQKLKEELNLGKKQIEGFLTQKEVLMAESQMLRQELDKQRRLVESVKQELENLTAEGVPTTEGGDQQQLRDGLAEMEKKLAMEIQQSDRWVKKYFQTTEQSKMETSVKSENKRETTTDTTKVPIGQSSEKMKKFSDSEKGHFPSRREEKVKNRNHKEWTDKYEEWKGKKQSKGTPKRGTEQRSKSYDDWKEKKDGWKTENPAYWKNKVYERRWDKRSEQWKEKKTNTYVKQKEYGERRYHDQTDNTNKAHLLRTAGVKHQKEHDHYHIHKEVEKDGENKFYKDFEDNQKKKLWEKSEDQSDMVPKHRHHDHNKFWKVISDHRYRVPQDCQGVSDCAQKEGLTLFDVALEPVKQQEFAQFTKEYLEKMNGSKYLADLEAFLSGFFDEGIFMHDKMRFKDFIDDVEDYLEDIAKKEHGNDDAVEDFDNRVLSHFFGEEAVRSSKEKRKKQQNVDRTEQAHKQHGPQFLNQDQHHKQMENVENARNKYEEKQEKSHYHPKFGKHPSVS